MNSNSLFRSSAYQAELTAQENEKAKSTKPPAIPIPSASSSRSFGYSQESLQSDDLTVVSQTSSKPPAFNSLLNEIRASGGRVSQTTETPSSSQLPTVTVHTTKAENLPKPQAMSSLLNEIRASGGRVSQTSSSSNPPPPVQVTKRLNPVNETPVQSTPPSVQVVRRPLPVNETPSKPPIAMSSLLEEIRASGGRVSKPSTKTPPPPPP